MSSIIEIAARNELLRQAGHNSARDFVQRLESGLLGTDNEPAQTTRPPSGPFRPTLPPNESSAPPPVGPRR
jgi:HPr kinase/phosphorylase